MTGPRPLLGEFSRAIHADGEFSDEFGISPSIDMATTYRHRGQALFHEAANLPRPMKFYGRYGNPTVSRVAALVANLHGGDAALMTCSGMAAISIVLFALLKSGDHVVAPSKGYGESMDLLRSLRRFGVQVDFLNEITADSLATALKPNTRMVFLETPTNPLMQVTDLAAVAEVCTEHGVLSVADNTLASVMNTKPLQHGIDIVVESGTKYMGGHSDVIAGAVVARLELLERIWWPQVLLGSVLAPHDAWLLQRGIRTMPMRVRQQNATALCLAEVVRSHPNVLRVLYPGLPDHPGHAVAATQMAGFGGMLSIELRGGFEAAVQFVEGLDLLTYAASLGDVHTLVMHPAASWQGLTDRPAESEFVPPGLIRISVGIEDAQDVIREVCRALDGIDVAPEG